MLLMKVLVKNVEFSNLPVIVFYFSYFKKPASLHFLSHPPPPALHPTFPSGPNHPPLPATHLSLQPTLTLPPPLPPPPPPTWRGARPCPPCRAAGPAAARWAPAAAPVPVAAGGSRRGWAAVASRWTRRAPSGAAGRRCTWRGARRAGRTRGSSGWSRTSRAPSCARRSAAPGAGIAPAACRSSRASGSRGNATASSAPAIAAGGVNTASASTQSQCTCYHFLLSTVLL